MSDSGDDWREHRDHRRRAKQRHAENCADGIHDFCSTPNTDGYYECMWCGIEVGPLKKEKQAFVDATTKNIEYIIKELKRRL